MIITALPRALDAQKQHGSREDDAYRCSFSVRLLPVDQMPNPDPLPPSTDVLDFIWGLRTSIEYFCHENVILKRDRGAVATSLHRAAPSDREATRT